MQLSVKTPPEMTLRILEKCAEMDERFPSAFVSDCVWQCLRLMDLPTRAGELLDIVQRYYHAAGKEHAITLPSFTSKTAYTATGLLSELQIENRRKRAGEATERLKVFRARLKKEPPSKHLHLKISEGMDDLPKRIKEKALWLRLSPNALVISCVRDCLLAMDDPEKVFDPPPIVVDFWTISHAKSRRKPADALKAMILKSAEGTLRQRSGPILDTVVRLALAEKWDATLEQILREADAITEDREVKP